jgi:hypothetical protein
MALLCIGLHCFLFSVVRVRLLKGRAAVAGMDGTDAHRIPYGSVVLLNFCFGKRGLAWHENHIHMQV